MLIADLSHYEDVDPDINPAAWKLAEHLRGVVRAATATPAGHSLESALPCRRRPGRRPCPGWLRVARQEVPAHIHWECSSCDDGGVIHGWKDSPYDLRPPPPLREQALIGIELSAEEHAELRRLQLLDLVSERMVWGTRRKDDRLVLVGTEDELDNLYGFVAAEANHLQDRRRQRRLDEVVGKVEAAFTTFG